MMGTQTCREIKHLRTDNGGEYKNDIFTKFYKDEGNVKHFTVRHTPQQNRVVERMNRTLLEKVQSMLSNARLGKEFWAEAVTYVCHLVNHFQSTVINGKHHLRNGMENLLQIMIPYMYLVSLHIIIDKKGDLSRDVTFNESAMLKKLNVEQLDGTPKKVEFERIIVPTDRKTDDNFPIVEGDYEEEKVQTDEPLR
ncbi:retrovirus-related pol polyprotein from transposon TNT 1-94 [Tanacetum coccineum]